MNKTEVMDMLRAEFQQLDREKLVERLVSTLKELAETKSNLKEEGERAARLERQIDAAKEVLYVEVSEINPPSKVLRFS